ncbi:MAG: hypothetical protein ACXIU8_07380 [Alkalilacustris sp.]
MGFTPLRSTTALAASQALILPQPPLTSAASAQEAELACLDGSAPPCAEGEPEAGWTPEARAEALAEEAAEAEEVALQQAEEAADALSEAAAAAADPEPPRGVPD